MHYQQAVGADYAVRIEIVSAAVPAVRDRASVPIRKRRMGAVPVGGGGPVRESRVPRSGKAASDATPARTSSR